ncbi:MAG: hypothetical protein LBI10_07535 [Deltaproteobacteria bacterium]|nr:hypothetical protein [Deltaproteobacteria bacterium]
MSSPATNQGYAYLATLYRNLFTNVKINSADMILGSGVVGVNNNSQSEINDTTYAKIDVVLRNIFGNGEDANIEVNAGYSLRGGGVIGVNGLSHAGVELTNLYDNIFAGVNVEAQTYLRGGGVVGVQNNDTDHKIPSTVYTPSPIPERKTSAVIANVVNNLFYNINVQAGGGTNLSTTKGELSGGGVLGVRTGPNAGSIEYLMNNVFKTITVTSTNGSTSHTVNPSILGGGVVGVSSKWWSNLVQASGNYFDDITINALYQSTTASYGLKGGGVIGLYSEGDTSVDNGIAMGQFLTDNTFVKIKVNTENTYGGGIIGAYTAKGLSSTPGGRSAIFESVSNNTFGQPGKTIEIKTNDTIYGGGLIGLYTEGGDAFADYIDSNTFGYSPDSNNPIIDVEAKKIIGGGIIGVATDVNSKTSNFALIQSVSNTNFYNQHISTTGHLTGGGIVGVVAKGYGSARLFNVMANYFSGNQITVDTALEGGGVIGAVSSGTALIDSIYDSHFISNTVIVTGFIDGGGIIGVTGPLNSNNINSNSTHRYGISLIKNSRFLGNTITATNGPIAGGLIYSYGLNSPMTIQGSTFWDNKFYSKITNNSVYTGNTYAKVYGTITIDTGLNKASEINKNNVVVLKSLSQDDNVLFSNNIIYDRESPNGTPNSLYFGRVESLTELSDGAFKSDPDFARSDAQLIILTDKGGQVLLSDPIKVYQDNQGYSATPNRAFQMDVIGGGNFIWGGANLIETGTITSQTYATNTINLYYGSNTILAPGMTLTALNHTFNLYPGGTMTINGQNKMTLETGKLYGTLQFNMATSEVNKSNTALLNITGASQNKVNVQGAVVKLLNFTPGPNLKYGDKFYLIETNGTGNLLGETYTKSVRYQQGYFTLYDFIIDKVGENDIDEKKQLVARLAPQVAPTPDPVIPPQPPAPTPPPPDEPAPPTPPAPPAPETPPAPPVTPPSEPVAPPVPTPSPIIEPEEPPAPKNPETPDGPTPVEPVPIQPIPDPSGGGKYVFSPPEQAKIVLEGQISSVAIVAGIGNWLADHSYKSADMALKEGNPLTHHAPSSGDKDHGWDPFAGVDAGLFWTNKGSKNKYRTFTFIAGLARQVYFPDHDSSFLIAAFADGGFASYDVDADYKTAYNQPLSGDGSLRYLGGGLMARQRWDNGFRLEASARAGRIENKFTSSLANPSNPALANLHYETDTPYLALHFGVGHEWMLSENSTLDLLVRYFWTKQDANTIKLSTGEEVDYDKIISQRYRIGARYTKLKSERFSYYLGASYEHELDTKTRGYLFGQPFEVPSLKGGSGIGEIGIIYRSTEDRHFNIEAGLQGHVGVRRGISGGVRLGWEF